MTQSDGSRIIRIVHPICCGMDVHKKYYRLKARRGAKKAIMAIAHRILLGIYHVIKDGVEFRDLGEEYLKSKNKSQRVVQLRKQALALGYDLVAQTVK